MFKKSELQILNHLTLSANVVASVSQIGRDIGISKAAVSKAIRVLRNSGLVQVRLSGRNTVCSVERRMAFITRLRIAFNLLEIVPKIDVLKEWSDKIILFGSCAEGTDTLGSDIDILVITRHKAKVSGITEKIRLSRPAQWILKTPGEYVVFNHKEKIFAGEIGRGIVLWEVLDAAGIR